MVKESVKLDHVDIPPGVFKAIPADNGSPGYYKQYSTHAATLWVVKRSLELFRVTPYKLGQLISEDHRNVYKWLDGKTRPSSLAMHRLLYLWDLERHGVDVRTIRIVDWETGQAYRSNYRTPEARRLATNRTTAPAA